MIALPAALRPWQDVTRQFEFFDQTRLSADEGRTWGKEIVLRGDAAAWDIGYTRTVQRSDGKLMTAYYWAAEPMKERVIEATIWDPGTR